MKRYLLIIIVMFFAISLVSYYGYRWSKINELIKEFSHIEKSSFELDILNKEHKLLINKLKTNYNYDKVAKSTVILNNSIEEFVEMLKETNDEELISFATIVKEKSKKLRFVYEDIKTDTAEIKNSLKWLSTNYKKYLISDKSFSNAELKLIKYIFNLLSATAQGDVFIKTEQYKGDTSSLNIHMLDTHLNVVHSEYNKLITLKYKLDKYDIENDLRSIVIYLEDSREESMKESSYIFKSLLISSIFLVLYAVIIYVREAISKLETEKLKNELEQFVNALNESAIVSKTNLAGKITYINDKFCEVSGYTREELMGKPHNIVRHDDMDSQVFYDLWNTIKNKKIFRGTIKNRKKNGDAYYVDTVIIPMVDIDDNIVEYLAVRYEVTDLTVSRDLAIMAEKAKGEFLSNMSHELRTPLNAIKGFANILYKQIDDSEHSKYLQTIIASSEHLVGLINDILDLSKLQSGNFSLDHHDFNLDEKLELFLNHFDAQLEASELTMNTDMDPSIHITLHADWLRISQIITNLISNAIKFSKKGSSIDFGIKYENGDLYIVVEDRGIGISEEAQEKIFKPFQQADNSTTRKYGGTGLGLSIVLNLVEQMGGDINLTSKEGEGSKFEIKLPVKEVSYIEESFVEEEISQKLSGHILIAEDNKTNQILIGIIVEGYGLTYTMADNGVDAIDKFSKEKFDLILMDENMPKMNGVEAMHKIRSMYGEDTPPIISLTANVMHGDRERFLEAGMDGYVSKPIDEKELYHELKTFLH